MLRRRVMMLQEGEDYVEIGGIKWATKNVGANRVTSTGLYFQWGDIQGYTASQVGNGSGQKYFNSRFVDYKFYAGTSSGVAQFNKYYTGDAKIHLELEDDSVKYNVGSEWRMPNDEDFNTLFATTTNTWVTNYQGSGVNGLLFTDKTDSSKTLFFPACGQAYSGSVRDTGSSCFYWSSLQYNKTSAHTLNATSSSSASLSTKSKSFGLPIRGILSETRITMEFYTISASTSLKLFSCDSFYIKSIEIDGVMLPSIVDTYTFATSGTHIVKYETNSYFLNNIPSSMFKNIFVSTIYYNSFPEIVKNIQSFAFDSAPLVDAKIPNTIETIQNFAFEESSLETCDIGTNISSIGDYAFYICTNLTSLTIRTLIPPTLGSSAFYRVSDNFKIYVPANSLNAYKTASGWSEYADKIYAIE